MKKFRLWLWGAVGISVLLTAILWVVSPPTIVMHFNRAGIADSHFGRSGLMLEPAIMLVLGAVCDRVAVHQRKQAGLTTLPVMLVGEWRLLALMGTALVVMGALQLNQIGVW